MNMPMLTSDLKTPKILWHQTDILVNLHIHLVDVEKYYLRVDRKQLHFSTIVNDTKYCVVINLFGAIIPELCKTTNTGREIRIKIAKAHRGVDWTRLQLEAEKNPMIIVDPDRVFIPKLPRPMLNFDPDSFQEYKRIHNITNIMPDAPSSDEGGESDDERFDTYFDAA